MKERPESKIREIIGVIGGTGSGKTTLVNMIPGFYYPTEGTLSIEGADIKEFKKSALQKKISISPHRILYYLKEQLEVTYCGGMKMQLKKN